MAEADNKRGPWPPEAGTDIDFPPPESNRPPNTSGEWIIEQSEEAITVQQLTADEKNREGVFFHNLGDVITFLRTKEIQDTRVQIRLRICPGQDLEAIKPFLTEMKSLPGTVDVEISECGQSEEIQSLTKGVGKEKEGEVKPSIGQNSPTIAAPTRVPRLARFSPLPAIDESIRNPFNADKPLVICLVDADETLIEPRRPHSIALEDFNQYILDKHPNFGGNEDARRYLAQLFKRYRKQEDDKLTIEGRIPKETDLSYNELIQESGNFYARSMEGVSIYKVFQVGEEFFEATKMERQLYDYAMDAVELNTGYGTYTVIVTGLPEPIAKPLTKKLKAQFYIAMKLEVRLDEDNPTITIPTSKDDPEAFEKDGQWLKNVPNLICTGKLEINTGTKKGKNEAVSFMVEPDPNHPTGQHPPHSIVYGWGNATSDLPLTEAGRDSCHSYDLHGFGMIVNPTSRTWSIIEEGHYRAKKTGKLRVFGEGDQKRKILEELDGKLSRTFENPRNAKKIAQILSMHGFSRREIIAGFKRHFPADHDILEIVGDIKVLSQQDQFIAECAALGLEEQARAIVSAFRQDFQSITPPEPAPRSSWPPPSRRLEQLISLKDGDDNNS